MASWKVNGVVLDSDDEEDESDSQDTLNDEPTTINVIHDVTTEQARVDSTTDSEDELAKDGYDLQIEGGKEQVETVARESRNETKKADDIVSRPAATQSSGNISADGEKAPGYRVPKVKIAKKGIVPRGGYSRTTSRTISRGTSRETSPSTNQVFRIPDDFLSQEERDDSIVEGNKSKRQSRETSLPSLPELRNVEADEISKSYIRLSSPLSSPPFSPLNELPGRKDSRPGSREQSIPSSPIRLQSNSGDKSPNPEEDAVSIDTSSNQPPRRAFRERKLIQRHPFTVEMGQYRKTLHGAGIKAITIDEEEERRKRNAEDSQDRPFEEEQDSQLAEFVVDQPSSQPQPVFDEDSDDPFGPLDSERDPTRTSNLQDIFDDELEPFRPLSPNIHRSNATEHSRFSDVDENSRRDRSPASDDDEDSDDLPDIRQMIAGHGKTQVQRSGKRKRPHTYKTSRTAMPAPSRQNEVNVFDFPLSPPITSPTPYSGTAQRILNRISSLGSRNSSPLTRPSIDNTRVSEIPTPVPSAARTPQDVIMVDSDSECEDNLSSPGTSRSSSPEPEDRIRRVAKRIRGVLPASWLRLDQQPKLPKPTQSRFRESESTSPGRAVPQRGVAIRKAVREDSPSASHDAVKSYFLDEESETDNEDINSFVVRPIAQTLAESATQFDESFADSVFGDAIEDDRIDRMLPSRKHAATFSSTRPSKKRKVPNKLFHENGSGHARQPKITEQFDRSRDPPKRIERSKTIGSRLEHRAQHRRTTKTQPARNFIPPRLSILDVVEPGSQAFQDAPSFIRIASRTARSRRQLGRHSPTRKFVRLDNIDHTNDAQSVLREWREGTILLNQSLRYSESLPIYARRNRPLGQDITIPPKHCSAKVPPPSSRRHGGGSRTLTILNGRQTTLDGVMQSVEVPPTQPIIHNSLPAIRPPPTRTNIQPLHHRPLAHPAQLETEEGVYNRTHPNAGFGTTKKGLDRVFRRSHRGAAVKGDLQLARFLADPDAAGSLVDDISYQADVPLSVPDAVEVPVQRPNRRRKRSPRHLDAGAHRYRQPSEPLPLETYFIPENNSVTATSEAGKLLNLQPYGTRYAYHFDIFPLQFGIYFHESTFVGSGRLSRVLSISLQNRDYSISCEPCLYTLDEKQLRWAEWDATVSSEMGLCFDWISGQLEATKPSGTDIIELVDFIQKYLEEHLFFRDNDDQKQFIRRICGIVDGYLARACGPESFQAFNTIAFQQTILTLTRLLTILMRVSQMCKQSDPDFSLGIEVEGLLQRTSERLATLLISFGVDKVRNFYEECQYISTREAGIRESRYYIEAWVVMMKVMQLANIPRSSFWDIVNKCLLKGNLNAVSDAQVFESIWYNMFTLLPLAEFTSEGVIRPGLRHTVGIENWALPQTLMKRIFAMYSLKSRQSAGFNDYARCLFVRCHHLMVEWGWRRCGNLIGTLFDFFASHNLAHLRNEESFNSPRFLEELQGQPSLSVEADDKCFHIFLKLVATSIKDMRQANDTRGIRNLVARLLPNHGRQYLKEEAIHQRDLASLRNHHDLLCTLFWAAPVDLRPSITLFQELVVPEQSHKEACLINLRAWSNLAKFLLATSPVPKVYQQLVKWEQNVFFSLVHRYQTAEDDIRQQHAALSEALQQQHSEQSLSHTIDRNREQVIEEINSHLCAIIQHMRTATDIEVAKTIFMAGQPLVTSALELFGSQVSAYDYVVIEAAFQFVNYYFSKTEQYQQSLPNQEYEEREAMVLGRAGCLSVFDDTKFFSALEKIVSPMLEKKLDGVNEKLIVEVWAKISACQARREDLFKNNITILHTRVGEWISGHVYPASSAKQAQMYAPLFMTVFTQQVPERVLKRALPQRDLFQEWLCSIAKPVEQFRFEYFWTLNVVKAHLLPKALLREQRSYLPQHIIRLKSCAGPFSTLDESAGENKIGLINLKKDQFLIIEGVIKYLSDAHKDMSNKPDGPQIRRHLADILKALMVRLKEYYTLAALEKQTTSSANHQQLIRRIISSIKTYGICPLDKFFTDPDTIYYHSAADGPNFFVPSMIHYGLHISEPGGEQKLLYFCWESIKGMVHRQECEKIQGLLLQVMKIDIKSHDALVGATKAMIITMAPAILWAAWHTNEGFIIADVFLRTVEEQILMLAMIDMGMPAEMMLPVFRQIIDGMWILHASDTLSISRPHLHLMARVIHFMLAVRHILVRASTSNRPLSNLLQQFANFTKAAEKYYEDKQLIAVDARFHGIAPNRTGIAEPTFGKVVREEYVKRWEYRNGSVWVKMGIGQRPLSVSSYSAAGEVLVRGVGGDEALAGEKELVGEVLDGLRVYNELLESRQERRKREMARAALSFDDVGL